MYDSQTFQVANPMGRYAIGDRDELTFNEDGSLSLYMQRESPGKDKKSNWLPSPRSGRSRRHSWDAGTHPIPAGLMAKARAVVVPAALIQDHP